MAIKNEWSSKQQDKWLEEKNIAAELDAAWRDAVKQEQLRQIEREHILDAHSLTFEPSRCMYVVRDKAGTVLAEHPDREMLSPWIEQLRRKEAEAAKRREALKGLEARPRGFVTYTDTRTGTEMGYVENDPSSKVETYTDYDGRRFVVPNAIKPTVHQSGHFPIDWMVEASTRASESELLVRIEVAKDGVVVIAHDGDDYEQHELPWSMMDKAEVNPLLPAIEGLEKKLRVLRSAKKKLGKAKAA